MDTMTPDTEDTMIRPTGLIMMTATEPEKAIKNNKCILEGIQKIVLVN